MREWRSELNKTRGLLCFSQNWESPVIWSHYADKHRGICLGFELSDKLVEKVRYVKKRLPVPLTAAKRFAPDPAFVRALLTTKYLHWKYEDEIRVFVDLASRTTERGFFYYPFSSDLRLTEIILGALCELPIERVRNLVSKAYPDAQVLKARLAFKAFHVVPRETSLDRPYRSPRGTTTMPIAKT